MDAVLNTSRVVFFITMKKNIWHERLPVEALRDIGINLHNLEAKQFKDAELWNCAQKEMQEVPIVWVCLKEEMKSIRCEEKCPESVCVCSVCARACVYV